MQSLLRFVVISLHKSDARSYMSTWRECNCKTDDFIARSYIARVSARLLPFLVFGPSNLV
jgi:hypothetical protein